jgi:hypothetical protein
MRPAIALLAILSIAVAAVPAPAHPDVSAVLRAATGTPEWGCAKADDPNLLASGPVAFIITTEHVILA